jgi:7-keto-8-aminopelargonate synthetase-like enzyme
MTEPLWEKGATPDERREIKRLDKEIAKLRKQSRALSVERNFIANRATVRARYQASFVTPAQGDTHVS